MVQLHTTRLWCPSCNKEKPDEQFPRSRRNTSRRGRDYKCRDCKSAYYRANRARMLSQTRAANIRRRYGMSTDEYDRSIKSGCVLCGVSDGRIVMDHCHSSGRVRGALCERCNHVLGRVEDSFELLTKMASYVR